MSIALYVHIPFCANKCKYCDFLSMKADNDLIERYFHSLYRQTALELDKMSDGVSSVYIGGGTPSFVDVRFISELLNVIIKHSKLTKRAEISMEANPASGLDFDKLKEYKNLGINRLSFGLQSTDERHLKTLGRIHSMADFIKSFDNARAAGFDNINVDLIYAIPNQSLEEYKNSLNIIIDLEPEHISAYGLIIEEGTEFYRLYAEDEQRKERGEKPFYLCTEESEIDMMKTTKKILEDKGYFKYETSNYSKKGFECKHNSVYWKRGDYLGLGLGAASLLKGHRFSVIRDMNTYLNILSHSDISLNELYENKIDLSFEDEIAETMILGLRLTQGINIKEVNRKYGINILEYFKTEIEQNCRNGLLTLENGSLYLTEQGFELSNLVMKDFI